MTWVVIRRNQVLTMTERAMIDPLRVILGLAPAPVRKHTCSGAALVLSPEDQRQLACAGIAFSSSVDSGEGTALCRVRCEAPIEAGVALCTRCAHLERRVREERRARLPR